MRRTLAALLLITLPGCGLIDRQGSPSCVSRCAPEGVLPGPCIEERDMDGDGIMDERYIVEYDRWCERSRQEFDNGADGTIEGVTVWERDGSGLLLSKTSTGASGWISITTYSHDEMGYLAVEEWDENGDGAIDYHAEYVNDEMGTVLDEKYYVGGELRTWTVRRTDDEGRVVVTEDHHYSCWEGPVFTGDVVAARTTREYDADGNLVLVEVDEEECEIADGIPDERYESTYDSSGTLLTSTIDIADRESGLLDGVPEFCSSFHYDERGFHVRTEFDGRAEHGHACDGIPEFVYHMTYDDAGLLLELQHDEDGDGDIELFETFGYDPCGNMTEARAQWDSPLHGWRSNRRTYSYGCWD